MSSLPYIPYFQTTRYRVQAMVELARATEKDKLVDLGSGDGRIVMAFAEKGIHIDGYELDSDLVAQSKLHIRQSNLTQYANIVQQDFWQEDLSKYSIITIYGMPDILEDLKKKLQKELIKGSKVLSNYYQFPHWEIDSYRDNVYRYIIK